jgi:homospermidine synthase
MNHKDEIEQLKIQYFNYLSEHLKATISDNLNTILHYEFESVNSIQYLIDLELKRKSLQLIDIIHKNQLVNIEDVIKIVQEIFIENKN